jgi:uncharacterized protein
MSTHTQQRAPAVPVQIFIGAGGLRSGWGCLLFAGFTLGLTFLLQGLAAQWLSSLPAFMEEERTPGHLALDRALQWAAALLATWLMARLEKRPLPSYGFSAKNFARLYVSGAAIGIAGLSLLIALLSWFGVWQFDGLHLHGSVAWRYGLVWAGAFAFTALAEETQLRGYLLAALTRGITFWPAAIVLALLFGLLHLGNGGENYLGVAFAVLAGIAFSYIIWQTGSLALVFGLHAGWDWGESFLYGTADSGVHVAGYLLRSHPAGNTWISGGSVGPEGSLLAIPVLLLMVLAARIRGHARNPGTL